MDCSPPGTSVLPSPPPRDLPNPRITLVSLRKKERKKEKEVSCCHVQLFGIPWTVTCQAPLFMEFSRQESWRELPFPSAGDLPDPGTEPRSPTLQADSSLSESPGEPDFMCLSWFNLSLLSPDPSHHCFSPRLFQ